MNMFHLRAPALGALLILASACSESIPSGPTGPVSPAPTPVSPAPAPTPEPTPASTFEISGLVTEAAPAAGILSGVRMQITSGPGAGTTVTTDLAGLYRFGSLTPGVMSIEAGKDGYLPWRVSNLTVDNDHHQVEVVLYPTPPTNGTGATATARCNDGTWSWSQQRADACTANRGIGYTVCPGPLCLSLVQ